jgi:hypothetical protein
MEATMKKFLMAAAAATLLAACATGPTPYQPLTKDQGGYTETKVESNRVRVAFAGNTLTSRETVENYLLYRSAETTLANGFDHFIISTRATDSKTRTYGTTRGDPFWDYHPWRYRYYDPYWDRPFGRYSSYDETTVTKYEASGEIVMYKGPKPADNPAAFDARDVVKNLEGKVRRPEPPKA